MAIIFNDSLILSATQRRMEETESTDEQSRIAPYSAMSGRICHCHIVCHSASVNKTEHSRGQSGADAPKRPSPPSAPSPTASPSSHFLSDITRRCHNCGGNSSHPSSSSSNCSFSTLLCAFVALCISCWLHSAFASAQSALPSPRSHSRASSVNNVTSDFYLTLVKQIRAPPAINKSSSSFSSGASNHVTPFVVSNVTAVNVTVNVNVTTNANLSSSLKLKRSNDPNEGMVIEDVPPSAPLSAPIDEDDEEEEEEEEEEESADEQRSKHGRFKAHSGGQKSGSFENIGPTNDNVDYVMHSPRTVNTKYGALQGIVITFVRYDKSAEKPTPPPHSSITLTPVEAFLGVPYASPPSGNLRFMPPVAPVHWRGVRQANHLSPVCPQPLPKLPATGNNDTSVPTDAESLNRNMSQRYFERLSRQMPYLRNQSEDCLYLNIYVPFEQYYQQRHTFRTTPVQPRGNKHRNNKHDAGSGDGKSSGQATLRKYPVIVFIHGEDSYDRGSGNSYDGSIWASSSGCIIVTLNYRLGVLGFLPAHVEGSVRGNYGLMDLVAGLHWIQENVAAFGGQPANVTLIGHGFGAACVHLLMLSPMAKGLFSRAALMSGSALAPSAIARDAENYAVQLAKEFNCPVYDNVQLVECLKRKSVDELLSVDLASFRFLSAFGPIVDGIVVPYEPRLIMESLAYGANSPTSSSSSSASSKSSSQPSPAAHFFSGDILFGTTRVECPLGLFSAYDERYGIEVERRNQVLRTLVRNMFDFHQQTILWTLINEYTDWSRPAEHPINLLDSTMEILTDALVVGPLVESMELFAKASLNSATSSGYSRTSSAYDFAYRDPSADQVGANHLYFYVFQNQNEDATRLSVNQRLGSMHADELDYLFGAPIAELVTGHSMGHFASNLTRPIDVSLSEAIIKYFTNFAKFGNPNFVSPSSASTSSSSASPSSSSSSSSESSASSGTAPHSTNYGASSALASSGAGATADQLRARFEQLNWPHYSVAQRRFLLIGSKPRVRDHYHSHRLSFWLNLIPRLMLEQYSSTRRNHDLLDVSELMADAFDKDEDIGRRYMQHHLLDNFDDSASYDGPVRQITWKNLAPSRAKYGVSTGTGWLRTSSAGSPLLQMNADQSAVPGRLNESTGLLFSLRSKTTSHTALQNGDKLNLLFGDTNSASAKGKHNGTGSEGDQGESGNYSTALSVTLAVGCSLLILNMLIFAGVYYQLDRHRSSRSNSPVNGSQMYQTNGGNAKHYEPSNLNNSVSTTLTNINDHNEATNYIHYSTGNADSQLLSIKSSAVHLDNGGANMTSLSPLTVSHEDYGTTAPSGHVHHIHYLEHEPSASSNTGTLTRSHHRSSNYDLGHHHHHHHLISTEGDTSDPSSHQAAMLLSSSSTANTPTVSYYPLHSFNTTSNSSGNELLDNSTMGRTSRIRFSLDSDNSAYLLEQSNVSSQQQQQQQPISILTNVPSSTDARSSTLKRVKI